MVNEIIQRCITVIPRTIHTVIRSPLLVLVTKSGRKRTMPHHSLNVITRAVSTHIIARTFREQLVTGTHELVPILPNINMREPPRFRAPQVTHIRYRHAQVILQPAPYPAVQLRHTGPRHILHRITVVTESVRIM